MRTWNRHHPGVGEWPPLVVTTQNVQPRIEEAAVQEPSRRAPAPRRTAFPAGVGAAVTGVEGLTRVVRKREALTENADALDDHRAVDGPAGTAAREPPAQRCRIEHAADRNEAAGDGCELLGGLSVEQSMRWARAPAVVATCKHEDEPQYHDQPVQPHLATPP